MLQWLRIGYICNGEDLEAKVTILAQKSNTSAGKTLEAFWLYIKNQEISFREECLVIACDLTRYPQSDILI